MDHHKKAVGTRINAALAISKHSQKELAEYVGVLPNVISYWLSGERTPTTEQLVKIAVYCNTSCDYLLGLSETSTLDSGLSAFALITIEQAKNDPADTAVLDIILSSDNFSRAVSAFANIKRINDGKKDFSPENYMQEIRAINAFEALRHEVIQKLTGRIEK